MPGRAGCFLLAAGLFVLICGAGCRAADAPAARVNDVLISQNELRRFINLMQLCNPEAILLEESISPNRNEQEFLHLLIGFELVNQAAAKAGVAVDPDEMEGKIEEMLQTLVETRYAGSLDKFHRQRKRLGLALDDLALFPRYELQAKALFDQVASTVAEADLLHFIEENPEMLLQPAAAELFRLRFADAPTAEKCLAGLLRGASVEKIAAAGVLDFSNLGWITGDDPFLEKTVREELFSAPEAGRGCLTGSPGQYDLYWIRAVRPVQELEFEDVKEEAALLKKCLLYEQFYYALWSEGRIEVYLR